MSLSRRVLLVGLVVALLAMQTLGFMHRVAHGPQVGLSSHQQAAPQDDGHGHGVAGLFGGLFAGHDDDSSCRVYDQLSHSDLIGGTCAAALPAVPPSFLILLSLGEAAARWAALFDARGPPPVL